MHFAPPWVKSEYLQVGNTILYPLPPGMKPLDQKPLEMAPEVVTQKGSCTAVFMSLKAGSPGPPIPAG